MRTTFNISKQLIDEVKACSGVSTNTAAVVVALEEYVRRRRAVKAFDAVVGRTVFSADPLKFRNLKSAADRARTTSRTPRLRRA